MPLQHIGAGTFIDTDPIEGTHIYPYVTFRSLEHATYGLRLTEGKATDESIYSIQVDETTFDPSAIAARMDFQEALKSLRQGENFEEFPFVEVTTEEQWKQVQEYWAIGVKPAESDEESPTWGGPGVYDFRDFDKVYDSVEAYELADMTYGADDVLEGMFQNDDWKDSFGKLVEHTQMKHGASSNWVQSYQNLVHRRMNKMEPKELVKMANDALERNANTGYIDIPAQLRASFLLGQAADKYWAQAAKEIKKTLGKEMKAEVAKLQKWGTAIPSEAGIKDVIQKILIKNNIPAYANLVHELLHINNPWQGRGVIPDHIGDRELPQPK